jgi:DNA-binding transcriptional LysR family regulator
MDRLDAMQMFLRIVETGSLSAVAREMGTTQPTISKQLTALEQHLNTRLLQRTTRKLSLTEAGALYYETCKRVVDEVRGAEATLSRLQNSLSGRLHVNTSIAFGQTFMTPLMLEFQRRHPALSVHLSLDDRFIDLVAEGVDVAVRLGRLADPNLVARKLGASRRILVAAPAYLEKHGFPERPEDLARHNCLLYSYLSTGNEWVFAGEEGEIRVRVSGNFESNNGHALREAVNAGLGVAMAPDWLAYDGLRSGRVVAILQRFEPPPFDISAVYPSNRMLTAKVRALIDFLQEEFGKVPVLNAQAG